jgi:AcrR family transcriptional regulator
MGIPERKERDFRRRQDEIVSAALELFDRDDWQEVTIEEIAQRAEIGKGTVYLHFPSKEALYARLAIDFSRGILEGVRAIDPTLPVLERIERAFRVFFDAHRRAARHRRVVEYCWRDDFRRRIPAELQREFEELDTAFLTIIHRDLEQGIAEGLIPAKPLPVLVFGLQAALVGAVRVLWSGCLQCLGPADPERYVAEVSRFAVAGLRFQDQAFAPKAERA